jgi:hypothetical protein
MLRTKVYGWVQREADSLFEVFSYMDKFPEFLLAKYDNVELVDGGAHGQVYE